MVGMSCNDAVLVTTSMQRPSDAVPGLRRAISRAASSPRGVAALPSPSRLADRLALTASITPSSRAKSGYSRLTAGRSSRVSPRAMPERSITSITPIHRHSTPIMDRHSSTPAAAPSSAPRATAGPFPVASPHRMAAPTIAVQISDIAISRSPLCSSPYIYGSAHKFMSQEKAAMAQFDRVPNNYGFSPIF